MSAQLDDDHKKQIFDLYSSRASSYDESTGGWHVELANDFVTWLSVKPGENALDLACGTGLVTIPLARQIGPTGTVVAVDLTSEMLDVAREKSKALGADTAAASMAKIEWHLEDITSLKLLEIPTVKEILTKNGGFDIISLCSAMVLLPDQPSALKFWVSDLLREGGRIIFDVPTEALTTQLLLSYHLCKAMGLPTNLSEGRSWIQSKDSVDSFLRDAGLTVERLFRTKSYLGETWYEGDEETAKNVFDEKMNNKFYSIFVEKGVQDEAKIAWLDLWKKALTTRDDGKVGFLDGHWLYTAIGRKQ